MHQAVISYFTNPKKIRLWYVCSFLLLIISLALTIYITKKLLDQSKQITNTDAAINNLELTLSYIKDAESGARGFIIMKDSSYLQPLVSSKQKADSVFTLLSEQITDSDRQRFHMNLLSDLIEKRFAHIYSSLDTFQKHKQQISTFTEQKVSNGKKIMDTLRLHINEMQQYEKAVMTTRQAKMNFIYSVVMSVNIASLTISVLLGFFAIYTYTKENRARQKADRKTVDYRTKLEERVKELRTANAELVTLRSNEKFSSTGRIARTIAHEVRNPLTNINLATEHLKEEFATTPVTNNMLGIIQRNSLRIQQLITDLLNSTRFTELKFEDTSVNDLIDQALMQAQDRLNFQSIEVVKNYAPHLSPISLDAEKLKIAFLNIIVNATEAMPAHKGVLTIHTSRDSATCFVSIMDNGCGMSSETLQRLFEPYFSQKEKGTGLGMTNTQNIILNHGGVLAVESKEGQGTTFTIKLPYQRSTDN